MTATEHDATHIIDKGCCDVMRAVHDMFDASVQLNAMPALEAVVTATKALHKVASATHRDFVETQINDP